MTARHLVPNISVDCVVFGFDNERLNVLLIEKTTPSNSVRQSAIPGDLITNDEDFDEAANRVLKELTDLEGIYLQQFQAFGHPNRLRDDKDIAWLQAYREHPGERVVTVAYFALVKMGDFSPEASSFAETVYWCDIHDVPPLAFDHNQIFDAALQRLRTDFENHKTGYELLPEKFTLTQLQNLYEIILDKKLDKRNFRKKVMKENLIVPTYEKQKGVLHKPAMLYEVQDKLELKN